MLIILLVGTAGYGLGRLSMQSETREEVKINTPEGQRVSELPGRQTGVPFQSALQTASVHEAASGEVVGSKNGTKYHLPWCSGAQRILETNKVWFASKVEAEKAGYTPAANCPGL